MEKKIIFELNLKRQHIKTTFKKNQFKAQSIQNESKGTEINQVNQIGRNETKVDLIWSNRNILNFRKSKLFSTNFKEKKNLYIIL